jgi:hypothetical protein
VEIQEKRFKVINCINIFNFGKGEEKKNESPLTGAGTAGSG